MFRTFQKSSIPFNPFARLGQTNYSTFLPLASTVFAAVLSDLFFQYVVQSTDGRSFVAIFLFIALIIYFSFRDGIKGGLIATFTTLCYYLYIIYQTGLSGTELEQSIEAVFLFSILYTILALVVGWLKQTLDLLIISEVKAREEAEARKLRLESVLDQLPVGVILADAKTNTVQANRHIENILGRKIVSTIPEDNSYTTDQAFARGKRLEPKDWPLSQALNHGKTILAEELEIVKPDNKRIFLRVNATPIHNKKGKIVAAVSTLYDVTSQKADEQRKDDFINMASHELKTPITSINLYLELLGRKLEKAKSDQKALNTLHDIQKQTDRLQELINDLLDMSRVQTGKLIFRKETCDINEIIQESIDSLKTLIEHRRITFAPDKPLPVVVDHYRIYQVITNLITNALKYSPEGTDIVINSYKQGSKVKVSVQDFGIGIDKDQLGKIFDRLYQVNDRTEKTFPGLGMGLFISKEIITRHKGKIWVESEKGRGSIFFFTLPLISYQTLT